MSAMVVGSLLMLAALLVSNPVLETGLMGQAPGSLSWGPTLFRVLLAFHGAWLAGAGFFGRGKKTAAAKESSDTSLWVYVTLGVMMAVAAGLRCWRLDSCLWLDEVLTMTGFAREPVRYILTHFPDQNQHMLYSLMAHGSLQLFGEHAWTLRLPSVFFGVGSIWALFLLAKKLTGVREALFACALMVVSYHHVWFSQNARGYMGLLFFATIGTYCWIEALDRDDWRMWLGYSVAVFLGMWIHLTMLFVPAAHALIYAGILAGNWRRERARAFKPLAAWLLAGTLTLQALAFSLPEFLRSALHEASMNSEWTKPSWVITEIIRSLRIGIPGTVVLLAGGTMIFLGWWSLFRKSASSAIAMVLPALFGAAAMFGLAHNIWPRFFFFCMGFALIIVVRGAFTAPALLFANPRLATGAGVVCAGLFVLASSATLPRCYALPKQDYSGARDYVRQNLKPGSHAVAVGLAALVYRTYYAPDWTTAASAAELAGLREKDPNLVLVYTLPFQIQAFDPSMWALIQEHFEITHVFPGTLGGGEIMVAHPRPVSAFAGVKMPVPLADLQRSRK